MLVLAASIAAAYLGTFDRSAYEGQAAVLDGDSLRINGHDIRLRGIDAPEFRQRCTDASGRDYDCGDRAKRELQRLIGGAKVTCISSRRDRFGRALSLCHVEASEVSLNEAMVKRGWAVDYGSFTGAELAARRQQLGLWAGSFEEPRKFRNR